MFRAGSLIALFLAAAPLARAQQPDPSSTVALVQVLLPYVGDKHFQQHLSLTPEQVKTLLAHRQKQWDEEYAMSPNRVTRTAADRDAATAAVFKSVLKPEQYKRATQLAAQDVWNTNWSSVPGSNTTRDLTRASVYVLTTYPEIATALKLSDDQQKLVSALSATGFDPRFGGSYDPRFGRWGTRTSFVYLTPGQTAAAKAFLGASDDTPWNAEYDTRNAGNLPSVRYGDLIDLALAKDVRAHVELTQAQQSELSFLSNNGFGGGYGYGGGGRGGPRGGRYRGGSFDDSISPAAQQKVTDILDAEMRATLAAILKPAQLTRLEQIARRTSASLWARMPSEVHLYFQTDVEAALKYTPEQRKQFDGAAAEYAAAVEKALRAGSGLEATEKAIKAAGANRDKAYAAVLTAAQNAKFKELLGEPFTGSTIPEQQGGGGLPNDFYRQYREATFGRYSGDLSTVGRNTGLATELKLSDEQVKKLRYAAFELSEQFGGQGGPGGGGGWGPLSGTSDKASEFIAKSLTDILTPEQAKRFRQIMLQLRDFQQQPGGGFGGALTTVPSAVSYPGVAEEIKLTAEQKEKLLDGTAPAEVLTAEQKAAIKAMHGEPYKDLATLLTRGGFGGMGGGPRGKLGGPGVRTPVILGIPWEPLKLNSDQMEKLAVAANRYAFATVPEPRPAGKGGGGPGGGVAASPAKLTAAVEAFEKELADILTAEQKAKLDPLELQQYAANIGLRNALTRTDVAKRVNLTPEQVQTITAAETDLRKFAALVEAAGIDYEKQQVLLVVLRDRLDARVVELLTADQKAAWKELTGEPWPGFKKAGLTSGNRGGPGGSGY